MGEIEMVFAFICCGGMSILTVLGIAVALLILAFIYASIVVGIDAIKSRAMRSKKQKSNTNK